MTVENQTPIKERLLADIRKNTDARGRCELSPDALGKRHGLNGHDLVKNLDQLRQAGMIDLTWEHDRLKRIRLRRGALNDALLAEANKGRVEKLSAAINLLPWQPNGFRRWDTAEVRQLSGLTIREVTDAMAALRDAGKIVQLGGGTRGVRIQGVRWRKERAPEMPAEPRTEEQPVKLRAPNGATREQIVASTYEQPKVTVTVGDPTSNGEPRRPFTMPETPELDKYLAARRLAGMTPLENPYIRVEFDRNPIAEEALRLKRELEEAMR